MFDIDLLNKTGLQQNISRIKINKKSKKQKIIFKKPEYNNELVVEESIKFSNKGNIISFLLVGILLASLVFIGTFDYDRILNNNIFITNNIEEKVFADIIRLLNNSDDTIIVESIDLDSSLNFSLVINHLDNIKLINNKVLNYSYRIYEQNKNQYKVLFSYPLNLLNSNKDGNQELSRTIMRYKNDYNVNSKMYNQSILFTSDSKTILEILEGLIYTGAIRIWPDGNGRFNLEYTS